MILIILHSKPELGVTNFSELLREIEFTYLHMKLAKIKMCFLLTTHLLASCQWKSFFPIISISNQNPYGIFNLQVEFIDYYTIFRSILFISSKTIFSFILCNLKLWTGKNRATRQCSIFFSVLSSKYFTWNIIKTFDEMQPEPYQILIIIPRQNLSCSIGREETIYPLEAC